MSEIQCPKCNAFIAQGTNFCPFCGYEFAHESSAQPESNANEAEVQEPETINVETFADVNASEVFNEVHKGNIFQRAINIIVKPRTEWEKIATEKPRIPMLLLGYCLVFSLIPFLSLILNRIFSIHYNFVYAFTNGFFSGLIYVISALAAITLSAIFINKFARPFHSESTLGRAIQLTAYSFTPMLIAPILYTIPYGRYLVFPLGLYGIFLLLFGQPILMKVPKNYQIAYFFTSIGLLYLSFFIIYFTTDLVFFTLMRGFHIFF
jgi:uncharacterized Zn finger protein (UPF0148 family)